MNVRLMGLRREKKNGLAHCQHGHLGNSRELDDREYRPVWRLMFADSPATMGCRHCRMGRVSLLALMLTLLTGCMKQAVPVVADKAPAHAGQRQPEEDLTDSVRYYLEQARLGRGDAYVRMANYYREGIAGKQNLLSVIAMGAMAVEYLAIPDIGTLFRDLPDGDAAKTAYQALDFLEHTEDKEVLSAKARELQERDIPEGYLMQAVLAWKQGDRDNAVALCDRSAAAGSTVAGVLRDIVSSGEDYGTALGPETLLKIADRFPMAYRILGDHYAGIPNDSAADMALARKYYLMASDHACLGRREARWLLESIYVKGYPKVDSLVERRLWSLCRQEINDSVIYLP